VFGFKCFTVDSGVPEFPPLDETELERAMRLAAGLGFVLIVHAEDAAVLRAAPPAAGRDYASFLRSRPAAAELAAITRVIALARSTGARAHLLYLSAADALPAIAAARRDGLAVSAETCPHYLALAAEDVPDGGTQFTCCPPIRERANAEQLWAAPRAGIIDCVVSDHSPCPPALKQPEHGDFGTAWGGISSLQLALPVTWSQARAGACRWPTSRAGWRPHHPGRRPGQAADTWGGRPGGPGAGLAALAGRAARGAAPQPAAR
jgi:allantoinase